MAGRKGRKRPKREPKSPKKKILSENVNETIALNFEEKKPKLDDELEKRDEQSPGKQEPNFETAIDSTTIDSVEEVTGDWQAEESKYVPPFSRRAMRALKRNGAPLSPVARPKRSWRGVQQNLNDAQPLVLCPVDSDEVEKSSDVVRNEGRPATLKDREEEAIGVERIEGKILCSQDVEDSSSLYSTSQTIEEIVAEKRGGVLPPVIVQNKPLAIVMHVLDEVLDHVCKMVQCSSDKTAMESEKYNKKSGEEEAVLAEALDKMSCKNTVSRSVIEHPVSTKQSLDTCMDATTETTCSPKTAATKEVPTESITEYSAYDGSALMAKTRTVDNTVNEATLDIKRSEDPSWECMMGGTDHAHVVLQSFNKVENLGNAHEVDNNQWNENACDFNNVHKEGGGKPQNTKTEDAAAISPTVKAVVTTTEEHGSTDPSGTLMSSLMDAELKSSGPPDDQRPVKKNCDQKSGNSSSPETVTFAAEDTENVSEKKVVTLELKEMPGSHFCENIVKDLCQLKKQVLGKETHLERNDIGELKTVDMDSKENMESFAAEVPSSNVGDDDFSDLSNPTKCQDVDQMVPNNFEHTTVLSHENPDAVEMTSKVCSDQVSSALNGEDKPTHMQSSVQASPITYTEMMHDTTEPESQKAVDEEKQSALSSSQFTQECSLLGSVGDILEFDCLMDCTDSQLVCLDSPVEQLATNQYTETREVNKNEVAVTSTSQAGQCTVDVPSDNGMIKGLISELSTLNKFLMRVWRELLEYQRKQKQRGLKLSKGKKLK